MEEHKTSGTVTGTHLVLNKCTFLPILFLMNTTRWAMMYCIGGMKTVPWERCSGSLTLWMREDLEGA